MNRDQRRADDNREELIERLVAGCIKESQNDITPSLQFFRYDNPTLPKHGLYLPSICYVAQGAKEVAFGDDLIRYDSTNYLLISLDVPTVSKVVEATPDKPYLALKLEFDPTTIASVMVEAGLSPGRSDTSVKSMAISLLTGDMLDAFVRLTRTVAESPENHLVSSMVTREIIYRILNSEQGPRLRQMAKVSGYPNRIGKAIHILRTKFDKTLSIEDLASELGMSVSSFHQQFKTATSMSPLQFQKTLRLQEARRLLMTENFDANEAAVKVGYEDASQFNREYKRMFGEPPMRDVMRFRQPAAAR